MTFVKTAPKRKISDFSDVIGIAKKQPIKKEKKAPYKVPDWYNKIKPSKGHGSGVVQQRAWRVVSEYVRQRDFNKYRKCVSCPHVFQDWKEGQAGHYHPFTLCHGIYKFDPENIFLQCAPCNSNFHKKNIIGANFVSEIRRRSGIQNITEIIEQTSEAYRGQKIENWTLVEMVARLAPHLVKE